jgi:hypothetical protein
VAREGCSQRQVCRFLRLNRSTYRYRAKFPSLQKQLVEQSIVDLSREHPELGADKIGRLVRRERRRRQFEVSQIIYLSHPDSGPGRAHELVGKNLGLGAGGIDPIPVGNQDTPVNGAEHPFEPQTATDDARAGTPECRGLHRRSTGVERKTARWRAPSAA